jgi:hypothetical protein
MRQDEVDSALRQAGFHLDRPALMAMIEVGRPAGGRQRDS